MLLVTSIYGVTLIEGSSVGVVDLVVRSSPISLHGKKETRV